MNKKTIPAAILLAVSMTGAVVAQDAREPAVKEQPARAERSLSGLKVQIVLSRTQGDKKISSVPYVLWLTGNDGSRNNLRMGTQIPIPDGKGSYSYRDVGTDIDVIANSGPDNTYRLNLTISDSSVYYPDRNDPADRLADQHRHACVPQDDRQLRHPAARRPDRPVSVGDRPGDRPGGEDRRDADGVEMKRPACGARRPYTGLHVRAVHEPPLHRIACQGGSRTAPTADCVSGRFTNRPYTYCMNVVSASTTMVFVPMTLSPTITFTT